MATHEQGVGEALNIGSSSFANAITPNAAGNLIVVTVAWDNDTVDIDTFSDTQGHTWTEQVLRSHASANHRSQVWWTVSDNTNATTVTASMSGSSNGGMMIDEFSGFTDYEVDVTAFGQAGTGTTMDSGSATTAVDDEILYGAATNAAGGADVGPGTGYTQGASLTFSGADVAITEYDLTNTAGSNNATASIASSSAWMIEMIAFRQPAAGTTTRRYSLLTLGVG